METSTQQIVIPKADRKKRSKGFRLPLDVCEGIERLARQSGKRESDLATMALRDLLKRAVVQDE